MKVWQRDAIRNLLAILGGGVLCAGMLAGWMIYKYNPSGTYYARNVLLAPEVMGSLKIGKKNYEFAGVEFSHASGNKMLKVPVSQERYAAFYKIIGDEKNLQSVPETVQNGFNTPQVERLVLKVKSEKGLEPFQEIQFQPQGDYYRVQLREPGDVERWAYYYHPQISQEVEKLLLDVTP